MKKVVKKMVWMKAAIGSATTFCLLVANAWAADITGTAYSIVVRNVDGGAQPPQTQPRRRPTSPYAVPASGGILRLVDVRTRREIGRANWDAQLGGFFFQLPLVGLPSPPPMCLALVDQYNRTVPVRDVRGNDPGTSFVHPQWDDLLGRSRELVALKAELAAFQTQRQVGSAELARLQAETAAAGAMAPGSCVAPPPPPPPPRPPDALEASDAERAGGPLCALRWEQLMGSKVQLGRLFAEAGLAADWNARTAIRELGELLPGVRPEVSKDDLAIIQESAVTGRNFLQHEDGVNRLVATQERCRRSVQAQSERARNQWQQQLEMARMQPERERQQCEARFPRIAQLKQAEAKAAEYAATLERQIQEAMRPVSSSSPESIGHLSCQL